MNQISQEIINYYRQFGVDERLAKKAYMERSKGGSKNDVLQPHDLPGKEVENLKDVFRLFKDIKEAYLIKRKVIFVPEDPLWVVIIKTAIPWYEIRFKDPQQEMGKYIGDELRGFFEKGTYIVTVDFQSYIKKAKLIPDSLVYKKWESQGMG